MFVKLGDLINRVWPGLLLAWVGILIALAMIAPKLEQVVQTEEFAFLPPTSPSLVGEKLFREAFPSSLVPSRIVIVVRRADTGLTEQDKEWIDDGVNENDPEREFELRERLLKIAENDGGLAAGPDEHDEPAADNAKVAAGKRSLISAVRTYRDKTLEKLILSKDGKATLVLVDLTTDFLNSDNQETVGKIQELLLDTSEKSAEFRKHIPPGLELSLSGDATVGRDMQNAARDSAHATENLTIFLVVFLLIAIYRAPMLALIPLLTVGVSVRLTMSLLTLMAQYHWTILFPGVQIYVTVLVYGAGVDYCLFLIDRYKEELDGGMSFDEASANCVAKVGAAIAASAGTVICGIGMMMFAEFGKFRQAGFAISFGLLVVLVASLTFTPALLKLTGRWAFWPQMRTERVSSAGGWLPTATLSSKLGQVRWLQNTWDAVGRLLLKRPMLVWLTSMALMLPFAIVGLKFFSHLSYGLLSDLPSSSVSVQGTKVVRQHFPAGATGPVTILLHNDQVDFSERNADGTAGGLDLILDLTTALGEKKKELRLADIRSVSHPLGGDESIDTIKGVVRKRTIDRSLKHYVSSSGNLAKRVTRMELTAELDPFALDSISHLTTLQDEIRSLLPDAMREQTEILVTGSTASIRDLKSVTDRDQIRIDVLATVVVFLILVVLLRHPAICVYLMVTVLFSYLVALGATYTFYWAISTGEFAGLDWKVPMFLFTILIAVGEDYNIFLMTRIEEEQQKFGPVQGVIHALSKTGRIISSCGIIMAGTFASLMAGSLQGMCQLGFALTFGVLLDTFVVRPILVPAYLVLLNSGRFGRLGPLLGQLPPPKAESELASNRAPASSSVT
ncbi:MAG: MMPL family transporter [Planctomycetota bacterium]